MRIKKKTFDLLILLVGTVAITFSGLNWQIGFFAWLAPICLLYFARNSRAPRFVLFFIFMSVAGYISQSCNNVFNDFVYGLINGLASGVIFTLIYIVDRAIYTKGKGFYSTLIFPSLYTTIEFLLSAVLGTSGIVAQSQFAFGSLAQLSTVTSIFGITFIVVWFASIINWIIEKDFNRYAIRKSALIYGVIFLAIMIYGTIRMLSELQNEKTVKVATISGVTDIHALVKNNEIEFKKLVKNPGSGIPEKFFAKEKTIRIQLSHTIEAAKKGAKIIVWSEDALILNRKQVDNLLTETKTISEQFNAYILLAFLEINTSAEPKLFNNKSVLITPGGEVAWEYRKSHPAPPEIPLINPGNAVIPFVDTEYGKIGNVICYDLDFPILLQQASKNDIDIMLVPAYDWKEYAKLHSKMARFEALQSGLAVIRSNGAGINMITDNYGNSIAETCTFTSKSKILYADLPLKSVTTIYSKIGNLFLYILMLFVLVIIALRIAKR